MSKGVSERKAQLRIARQPDQLAAAARIRQQAPRDVQDVWIDDTGQLMANVLNANGEKIARAAGATPRPVTLAREELQAVIDELADDALRNPPVNSSGASFEIDVQTNKVLARYFFTTDGGEIPALALERGDIVTATAEVATLGTTARVEPAQGLVRKDNRNAQCSIGWAVDILTNGQTPKSGVMTAGHCFDTEKSPESSVFNINTADAGNTDGTGKAFTFGEDGDYGFIQLRDGDEALTQLGPDKKFVRAVAQTPIVGSTVCKLGITTDETCGKVLRVGVTKLVQHNSVSFLVRDQIRADYCAEGGDSGGPVYAPFESDVAAPGIAAMGTHSSSILYLGIPRGFTEFVCGENASPPRANESDFMPIGNMIFGDIARLKIAGG
jgi:streptogrisin D